MSFLFCRNMAVQNSLPFLQSKNGSFARDFELQSACTNASAKQSSESLFLRQNKNHGFTVVFCFAKLRRRKRDSSTLRPAAKRRGADNQAKPSRRACSPARRRRLLRRSIVRIGSFSCPPRTPPGAPFLRPRRLPSIYIAFITSSQLYDNIISSQTATESSQIPPKRD